MLQEIQLNKTRHERKLQTPRYNTNWFQNIESLGGKPPALLIHSSIKDDSKQSSVFFLLDINQNCATKKESRLIPVEAEQEGRNLQFTFSQETHN